MKIKLLTKILFLVSLVFISTEGVADDAKNLKEVMQRISHNMSRLIDPIMKGEFYKIDEIAEKVANHDEPPLSHRLKIIAELGLDFTHFKKIDDEVHINSVAIQTAAKNKDIEGVINSYAKTMASCNSCHKKYRKRIQKMML